MCLETARIDNGNTKVNIHELMADNKQQEQTPMVLSSTARKGMRYFADDEKRMENLKANISHVSDDTVIDLIRKAVHLGLPLLEKQWEPIIKANTKGQTKSS
jgi:hypothetical protein